MSLIALLPFAPARWFDNSSKALAGGFLTFYQRGTSTLATGALWRTPDRTAGWTNPVQLDASGHADIFLDPGAYTVSLTDSTGAAICPPVDVIQGSASFDMGGGTAVMLANYAAVRALATTPDAVYVLGRTSEGDGGEGWFQRVPGSSLTDDSGVVLVSTAAVYRRVFSGCLRPEWFGVVYGATAAQDTAMGVALASSAARKIPLVVAGSVYLGASIFIPSGVAIRTEDGGAFVSGSSVYMTFQAGSAFEGSAQCFGASVQPFFYSGVVERVRLSWMGGATGDDRLLKANLSLPQLGRIAIDVSVSVSTSIGFNDNSVVVPDGGTITITGGMLNIPVVEYAGQQAWISVSASAASGVSIGSTSGARPGWFAGTGAGEACLRSGFVLIGPGESLAIPGNVSMGTLRIESRGARRDLDGIVVASGKTLTVSSLYARGVLLSSLGGGIVASSWDIDGCSILGTGPWGYVASATDYTGRSDSVKGFGTGIAVDDLSASAVVAQPFAILAPPGAPPLAKIKAARSHSIFTPSWASLLRTCSIVEPGGGNASIQRYDDDVLIINATGWPGGDANPLHVFIGGDTNRYAMMADHTSYSVDIIVLNGNSGDVRIDFFDPSGVGSYSIKSLSMSAVSYRATICKDSDLNGTHLIGFVSAITSDSIYHS